MNAASYNKKKTPKLKCSEHADQIKLLENILKKRFLNFQGCKNDFYLFTLPLSIEVETV